MSPPTDLGPVWRAALAELDRRRELVMQLGGEDRVARQHDRGLLTARERVDLLVDPGSKVELGQLCHSDKIEVAERSFGDGVVAGLGRIDGRRVCFFATDSTVRGGAGGEVARRRKDHIEHVARQAGIPIVHIDQSGGARIDDIMTSRFAGSGGGNIGEEMLRPRRSPHLVAACGSNYAPWNLGLSDFAVMTRRSAVALVSPPIIEVATSQKVTEEELGGPDIHAKITGQVDRIAEDDAEAMRLLREMHGFLPEHVGAPLPVRSTDDAWDRTSPDLFKVLPERYNRAYDMHKIIRDVVDDGLFLETAPEYGRAAITGYARFAGRPVGIIGNQPMHIAGVLDHQFFIKARRITEVCGSFGLPLVYFVDTPGVAVGTQYEQARILAESMVYATARLEANVPRVCVVIRKGYGLAYFAVSGASMGRALTIAWPSARLAFMGPEPAVRVMFRRELEASPDPGAFLEERASIWRTASEPWEAARHGYLDDVIDPAQTRPAIVRALRALEREGGQAAARSTP